MFQQLLVALDGSERSLQAADVAIELAAALGAQLDILSVEESAISSLTMRPFVTWISSRQPAMNI